MATLINVFTGIQKVSTCMVKDNITDISKSYKKEEETCENILKYSFKQLPSYLG